MYLHVHLYIYMAVLGKKLWFNSASSKWTREFWIYFSLKQRICWIEQASKPDSDLQFYNPHNLVLVILHTKVQSSGYSSRLLHWTTRYCTEGFIMNNESPFLTHVYTFVSRHTNTRVFWITSDNVYRTTQREKIDKKKH